MHPPKRLAVGWRGQQQSVGKVQQAQQWLAQPGGRWLWFWEWGGWGPDGEAGCILMTVGGRVLGIAEVESRVLGTAEPESRVLGICGCGSWTMARQAPALHTQLVRMPGT
jgi:hypothetical protein